MAMAYDKIFASPNDMNKKISAYLRHCDKKNKIPTASGFAIYSKCYKDVIKSYERNYPEYAEPIARLRTHCQEALITGGLTNKLNNAMALFLLKANYGMIVKQYIQSENVNVEAEIKLDDESINKIRNEIQELRDEKFGKQPSTNNKGKLN